MSLPKGRLQRLFYGVFFLFFAYLVGGGWVILYRSRPNDTFRSIVRFVILDFLSLFFTVLFLAVVWCLFTPKWVERIFDARARTLVLATIVLMVGLAILMAVPGIITR